MQLRHFLSLGFVPALVFAHRSPSKKPLEAQSLFQAAAQPQSPLPIIELYKPVAIPESTTCNVKQTLMVHTFASSYGVPFVGQYTPPECEFNNVVIEWTVTSAGRQFDRLAEMFLGDIEVWRTSTAEPTASGIIFRYQKDLSMYLSLWKSPQQLIFSLNNVYDSTYTGAFNTSLTATFSYNPAKPAHADLILPITPQLGVNGQPSIFTLPGDSATVQQTLPRNVSHATVSIAATGQSNEEFWYTNAFQSDIYTFESTVGTLIGYGPFREVQLYIDDMMAGVAWPFPVIFTGGIAPGFWRPVVGIDAYDLREYEIDITPFLPYLLDGDSHSFSIRVVGMDDNGGNGPATLSSSSINSYWLVNGKVFLFYGDEEYNGTHTAPTISTLPMVQTTSDIISTTNGTNGVATLQLEEADKHDQVLRVFRCLIADLCEQFGGGHPGGAMGMAAIGVSLWKYVMKYSPANPNYFNRDRFVLSNGHTCLFQYTFMHLVGYKNMTIEQLKSYHSDRADSICPGHPEIEHEGIEVTTGPLGQGVANAVGMAMATKHLAATYNKPNYEVVNNMTYCMIGDACLQEGVALEAVSLAGHWKLNNLVLVYDNNQITCDGSVDITCNDDVNEKMKACGWNVIDVTDGTQNISGIVQALVAARASDKPTFVNIRTIIGIGSASAGDAKAHGAAFGVEDVANIKRVFGMNPEEHFIVPDAVYDFFHEAKSRGQEYEKEWSTLLEGYSKEYPELAEEFKLRVAGKMPKDWTKFIPAKGSFPTSPTPSRKSSGMVCNPLAQNLSNFMVGTADLTPSVNMTWKDKVDFQQPDLKTACGINGNYSGRYIHWGIREHAMAAISNGLAAYNKGTIFPVTSSFFMFYIYAAPGIRMGALQGLQQIHIATHDSIGTGEDGPTHQPIALAALYRSMPNLLYIRPCDSEETAGAFIAAIKADTTPSIISLSRQALTQYPENSDRDGVQKGAYVFMEQENADVTLIGVGSEMFCAVETKKLLEEQHNIKARVVSFPCQRLFEKQSKEYKQSVLQHRSNAPRVVIEAYAVNGWERYADAGYSMASFGKSLPGKTAYKHFGFDAQAIAPKVKALVEEVKKQGIDSLRGDFRDLNGTMGYGMHH